MGLCQAGLALDGIEIPPELQAPSERFVQGELTRDEFSQACLTLIEQWAVEDRQAAAADPLSQ